MLPASTVAATIRSRLAALDNGGAPDADQAWTIIVEEIRAMVLTGVVNSTGTAADPVSGPLAVVTTGTIA